MYVDMKGEKGGMGSMICDRKQVYPEKTHMLYNVINT